MMPKHEYCIQAWIPYYTAC